MILDTKSKIDCFKTEASYIKDNILREDFLSLVNIIPDYFFSEAASSTGKYHPEFSLGDGGLLRHTKAACRIAKELLDNPIFGDKYTDHEKDLFIIAICMHDSVKRGIPIEKYTRFDHPLLASKLIKDNKSLLKMTSDDIIFICSTIESHMGPWNTNDYSNVILPIPKNKYQSFVHLCDYLASRKFLDIKFKDDEIVNS